jgi:transcription elongation factor GreA
MPFHAGNVVWRVGWVVTGHETDREVGMREQEYLTPEGLKKLEEELEFYKTVKRGEVAQRLRDAMSEGEVEENPEYEDAKNEQAFVEGKIIDIEQILSNAILIENKGPANEVRLGSKVSITEVGTRSAENYVIVGSAEADPINGKISHESPLGKALIGRKVNETFAIQAPDGAIKFKVTSISNK